MDSEEDVPPKRPHLSSSECQTCIICSTKALTTDLVHLKDTSSWDTLHKAALIRGFDPILQLSSTELDVPDIFYHRNCRSKFTLKKSLGILQSKGQTDTCDSPSDELWKSSRKAGPSAARVYEKICIFCNKSSKYFKRTQTREPLIQSSELRADETIRSVATQKMDNKILAITSRELVAAEAHYHKTCYRDCTRDSSSTASTSGADIDNGDKTYAEIEHDAYQMLFADIRTDVILTSRVVTMVELKDKLTLYMNQLGIKEVKRQTRDHIRRKLEFEFKDCLKIFPDKNGILLVVPDNLTVTQLASDYMQMRQELQSQRETVSDTVQMVNKAALYIRNDIKSSQDQSDNEWPPKPEELDYDFMALPVSLRLFLKTLLSGDGDPDKLATPRVNRIINSVAQDCIYAVGGGVYKTAKHILLPWAVKTLTGNVEVIKILNRLGHGVSYSKLEEVETALCLQKLENQDTNNLLPSNIHPRVPTSLAYDNIDRLEETLSGSGTSHRVNGIVVQPKVHTVELPKNAITVRNQKKRSITPTPHILQSYNAGDHVGPPSMAPLPVFCDSAVETAQFKNLIWTSLRQIDTAEQKIGGWTGFNIMTRDQVNVTQDTIGYLPTINAPATEMKTVNEVLTQALKIKDSLDLNELVCVFDQALYAKAAEITWKDNERFRSIVLRMGVFHTICNLLGTIGKRFQDAGLRDLAVEAGVISDGSIDKVMGGKKYNRAVRLHKLVYEALHRLIWKGFDQWLQERPSAEVESVNDAMIIIADLHRSTTQTNMDTVLHSPSCIQMFSIYKAYLSHLRSAAGQLSQFWMSYIDIVEVLLNLIRSSREGEWMLHLSSIRAMLPWCFAYDKHNYSRYLSVYYTEMRRLPVDHPEIHNQLANGGFSVQIGENNPYGRIPVDQTIEETINKDTQTAGGTKGFSLKQAAVSRYYITAEYRSSCLKQLRQLTEIQPVGFSHPDLHQSRIRKDEADVQALVELLDNEWVNPFNGDMSELISISTGRAAPRDVAEDLLTAHNVGEDAYKQFQEDRIERQTQNFHDRLPKLKLKTFTNVQKKTKTQISNKETVLKADHKLFAQMVLIASNRNLEMCEVLAHPLGPLPWSLGNADGTLKKTNKAALVI